MTISDVSPVCSAAITLWKDGERKHWQFCQYASKIVGKQSGETRTLSSALAISPDTIEKRAMAWRMYRSLRIWQSESGYACNVRTLRNRLSIKHFWVLAQLWRIYEFDPIDAINYLQTCADERASAETMRVMILGEQSSNKSDEWKKQLTSLEKLAMLVYTSYGIPEDLRYRIQQFLKDIQPWLNN